MKLFWLLSLVHLGSGICPKSAETAPQFEEFLNLTQGENLYDGKSKISMIFRPDSEILLIHGLKRLYMILLQFLKILHPYKGHTKGHSV